MRFQKPLSFGTCGFESHPPHAMRPEHERSQVRRLAAAGLNPCQIARATGIPRSTLREWLAPRRPSRRRPKTSFDQAEVPTSAYAYLLGFYLGDGTISLGRRDVYRLRIRTDSRYPGIIEECVWAMGRVMPM